jgi:hypothetical protein
MDAEEPLEEIHFAYLRRNSELSPCPNALVPPDNSSERRKANTIIAKAASDGLR